MTTIEPGKLIILSGPSGAGKSTVVRRLLESCPCPVALSVSATTRQPRPEEKDGIDYFFLTREDFERKRKNGEFLECFQVFGKEDWYGTLREAVTTSLSDGKWVLLEIDVQGAMAVVRKYHEVITIFLQPSSLEELERRLRGRGTENEETIKCRLDVARSELKSADKYMHQVINDTVDRAVDEICNILSQSGE